MAIARMVAFYAGATALMGALGFVASAIYWSLLSSCAGNAECLGSEATFLLFAVVLSFLGVLLIAISRIYRSISN
jgi:hypothetical protein